MRHRGSGIVDETAAARFREAIPQADVSFVEDATHSLITDLRDEFGRTIAEGLTRLG